MFLIIFECVKICIDGKLDQGSKCVTWAIGMHNLVKYCVPLLGGSISRPFHDVANLNYSMTQKVTPTHGCYGNYCNHSNRMSYQYLIVKKLQLCPAS